MSVGGAMTKSQHVEVFMAWLLPGFKAELWSHLQLSVTKTSMLRVKHYRGVHMTGRRRDATLQSKQQKSSDKVSVLRLWAVNDVQRFVFKASYSEGRVLNGSFKWKLLQVKLRKLCNKLKILQYYTEKACVSMHFSSLMSRAIVFSWDEGVKKSNCLLSAGAEIHPRPVIWEQFNIWQTDSQQK